MILSYLQLLYRWQPHWSDFVEFEGTILSKKAPDETIKILKDFSKVSRCLPGVESYEEKDGEYFAKIRLDISEMGNSYLSTLSGRIRAKYEDSGEGNVIISASGRIAGSSLKIILTVSLDDRDGQVSAGWKASVDFGILLRMMGESNVRSVAESNINQIMNCVRALLE